MGGIGMMSAGLIGAPGLGYAKDRFAGEALLASSAGVAHGDVTKEYLADKDSKFLIFEGRRGLDGKMLSTVQYELTPEGAAVVKLTDLAGGGDAEAQAAVQKLRGLALGGDNDPKIAIKQVKKLAEAGDPQAKAAIETLGRLETSADKKPQEAVAELKKLAEQGDRDAQSAVALLNAAAFATGPKVAVEQLKKLAKDDPSDKAIADRIKELSKPFEDDPKAAMAQLTPLEQAVQEASIAGDRRTLVADSIIPATMAVIYLIMLLYFRSIGGYKPVRLEEQPSQSESMEAQAV
jgi:hypothetical protein